MSKRHERFQTPHDEYIAPIDNYRAGVERATQREKARQDAINERLEALVAYGKTNDVDAAKAAKERSEARKAKYPPSVTYVKFTPVAKGSEPIRVNPRVGMLSRRDYRRFKRYGVSDERIASAVDENIVSEALEWCEEQRWERLA